MVIDWTDLIKLHKGKWVALGVDEKTVIASADSVKDVRQKAALQGQTDPILFKVPSKDLIYIG